MTAHISVGSLHNLYEAVAQGVAPMRDHSTGTHSSVLTQAGRTIASGRGEATGSWGAALSHHCPLGPRSHTVTLCKTRKVTAVKLKTQHGFIYTMYVYQLPIFTSLSSQFSMQTVLLPLLQPNPGKPLLQMGVSRSLISFIHSPNMLNSPSK